MVNAKTQYPQAEKLFVTLITSARKLRPYFQAHKITVLTNFPLRQLLQKPETSGRLMKWEIELSEYDIQYKPWTAIKGQTVADFIAEFTISSEVKMIFSNNFTKWVLYVDGSSNEKGCGAKLLLYPEVEKSWIYTTFQILSLE